MPVMLWSIATYYCVDKVGSKFFSIVVLMTAVKKGTPAYPKLVSGTLIETISSVSIELISTEIEPIIGSTEVKVSFWL
jgi:hypothetical protein